MTRRVNDGAGGWVSTPTDVPPNSALRWRAPAAIVTVVLRSKHDGQDLLRNRVRIKSAGLDYTFAKGSVWYQTEQNSATV